MKRKMFDRYIYIWDIHWNKNVFNFIKENNDSKTYFILMGDLFDRWNYSYELIELIKQIYKDWRLNMVLGNHDLFFIFSQLSNPYKMIYDNQFKLNKWKNTYNSFKKNIIYKRKKSWINLNWYMYGIAQFLLENFDLYLIDDLWNLSIHGGIPILFEGSLVWESFKYNEFSYWLDYVKELNNLIKKKDIKTLEKFTAIYQTNSIIRQNEIFYNLKLKDKEKNYWQFLPTWYLNREYTLNENIKKTLLLELDKNNINKFFTWHDMQYLPKLDTINNKSRIIRLDYGVGVLIMNKENKIIEKLTLK